MEQQYAGTPASTGGSTGLGAESDSEQSEEGDAPLGGRQTSAGDTGEGAEDGSESSTEASSDSEKEEGGEEEEDVIFRGAPRAPAEPDAEDLLFMEECNKMLLDAINARRNEVQKVQSLDVPIPSTARAAGREHPVADGERVAFSLLTKKGQKPAVQQVHFDASMASRILASQQAERAERELNKRFVMQYEQGRLEQEEDSYAAAPGRQAQRGTAGGWRGGRGGHQQQHPSGPHHHQQPRRQGSSGPYFRVED